jgi:hypothetical protein
MKTFALSSLLRNSRKTERGAKQFLYCSAVRPAPFALLMIFSFAAFSQNSSDLFDKAPPAIDDALRARVNKFYELFIAGKFKDAYSLVADDSQDKFFQLPKDQYKNCEIIKINYSANFSKAAVVTSCKSDWRFHGAVTLTTFPLTSNWEVVEGQWFWHFERPTMVPSPFSPTGFVPVPPESIPDPSALVPKDIPGAAKGILAKVSLDKALVNLKSDETSEDVVHVRNDMPGEVSLKVDQPNLPGLKVTLGKTNLKAHEETTLLFDWRLDDPTLQCPDCAKKAAMSRQIVQLHIEPTRQIFRISVAFDSTPPQAPAPPQK